MDREQRDRVIDDDLIYQLIDEWHICPYSDKVDELFDTLKKCTESYLKHGHPLNTKIIVTIVKDLRAYLLAPEQNKNLLHFTDRICDAILFRNKGITSEVQEEFNLYIDACLLRVYTNA